MRGGTTSLCDRPTQTVGDTTTGWFVHAIRMDRPQAAAVVGSDHFALTSCIRVHVASTLGYRFAEPNGLTIANLARIDSLAGQTVMGGARLGLATLKPFF